ncbi:MAG: hypothetical protein HY898_22655 [Deltaproteobacteria bacterium]|nr:hypothetical protein [Deltaproteobacteria bacterium]
MTRSKILDSRSTRSEAIREAAAHLHAAIDALAKALDVTSDKPIGVTPREVMKPSDYAEYMRVNVRKVHSWIKKGMPHFLLEGRVRIRVKDADAWLEERAGAGG